MLNLWARNVFTTKYEFIKQIYYHERFSAADDLDPNIYYEIMLIDEFQNCIFYMEREKPNIKRLRLD